jgi:Rieske Fe-S protein
MYKVTDIQSALYTWKFEAVAIGILSEVLSTPARVRQQMLTLSDFVSYVGNIGVYVKSCKNLGCVGIGKVAKCTLIFSIARQ